MMCLLKKNSKGDIETWLSHCKNNIRMTVKQLLENRV